MQYRAKISKGGKISIPVFFRKQLNITDGEEILLSMQDDKLVISSMKLTLEAVRQKIKQFVPKGKNLVDELFMMRREDTQYD